VARNQLPLDDPSLSSARSAARHRIGDSVTAHIIRVARDMSASYSGQDRPEQHFTHAKGLARSSGTAHVSCTLVRICPPGHRPAVWPAQCSRRHRLRHQPRPRKLTPPEGIKQRRTSHWQSSRNSHRKQVRENVGFSLHRLSTDSDATLQL